MFRETAMAHQPLAKTLNPKPLLESFLYVRWVQGRINKKGVGMVCIHLLEGFLWWQSGVGFHFVHGLLNLGECLPTRTGESSSYRTTGAL